MIASTHSTTLTAVRPDVVIRRMGIMEYAPAWHAMQAFNAARGPDTPDEIWLLEHPPVYTLGMNAKSEYLPSDALGIPIVPTDRGGEITYHGPGQLVAYVLMDLKRRHWGIRQLVSAMEQAVLDLLATHDLSGERRKGAPGVYVNDKKLASLGLRVRRGGSYHGLSVNVAMDLAPFQAIAPCGFRGLEMTQLRDLCPLDTVQAATEALLPYLIRHLEYNAPTTPDA